jgi:hypothetical protein
MSLGLPNHAGLANDPGGRHGSIRAATRLARMTIFELQNPAPTPPPGNPPAQPDPDQPLPISEPPSPVPVPKPDQPTPIKDPPVLQEFRK